MDLDYFIKRIYSDEKRLLFAILISALTLRLIVAFTSQTSVTYDSLGYDQRALSIVSGEGYSFHGRPTAVKPPLYSIFLAGIYKIFGHNYLFVRIIQSIIGAITCIIIYYLGKEILGKAVGIVSAILFIFYPVFIKSSVQLLTECLFTLMISLISLYILRISRGGSLKNAIFLGAWLGISVLTRSLMVFFVPLILFLIAFNFIQINKNSKLKILITITISFLLLVSPWVIRNYIVYHAFVLGGTQAGEVLYTSYNPRQGYLYGFTTNDEVIAFASTIENEVERSGFLFKKALESIKERIREVPRMEVLKVVFFWSIFDWEILSADPGRGVYNFFYVFFLPFSIVGAMLLWKDFKKYSVLFIPVIFFQLLALVFFGSPRYRMAIEPSLIIFAGAGINYFYRRIYKKNIFYLSMIILFCFNFIVYLYSDQLKIFTKHILQNLRLLG